MAILKRICSQTWVPGLCLSTPDKLVSNNYLADKEITPHNAQLLLHLICNPQSNDIPSTDPTELIANIIKVNFNEASSIVGNPINSKLGFSYRQELTYNDALLSLLIAEILVKPLCQRI